MRVSHRKTLLWLASGILAAGSVAVLAYASLTDVSGISGISGVTDSQPAAGVPSRTSPEPSDRLPPADTLRQLCRVELRRPLYDAPPPVAPAPPPPPPPPPLNLKLVGTVVEPGRSRAVLQGDDGKVGFKRVGDQVAGAEIVTIERSNITVRYYGQLKVLKIDGHGGGT